VDGGASQLLRLDWPRLIRGSIAEDFAELREGGLTNPLMPKIEKALGIIIR
jgi:hypothetical protein